MTMIILLLIAIFTVVMKKKNKKMMMMSNEICFACMHFQDTIMKQSRGSKPQHPLGWDDMV